MKKLVKAFLIAIPLIAAGVLAYWFVMPRIEGNHQQGGVVDSSAFSKPVPRLYGLAVDSFLIENGTIGRNETLGKVLSKYSLPQRAFTQLLLYADQVFDLRKIKQGNSYTAFLSQDTLYALQYLVYEHSPVDYVVFDFTDSVEVSLRQKDIITRQKRASGEITSSLWEAITKNNINPMVAIELSEIYAWTVDFFGLQPGDHFSVVYDELFVDTVSIGLGRIHAASFNHVGKELLAIPFTQDSVETYYDADGNSLKRAFLKAPLRYSRISSRFSGSRLHPILKIRRPHYGVDYAAPVGTPVYAIGDGRVIMKDYQKGAGRIVKVRHNSVYTTTYMHLSSFGKDIAMGRYVKQGDLLGYVGSSGLSTGPHLDFRVTKNGSPIDPLKMESPPVDPIKSHNKLAFEDAKQQSVDLLQGIDTQERLAQDLVNAGLPALDYLK